MTEEATETVAEGFEIEEASPVEFIREEQKLSNSALDDQYDKSFRAKLIQASKDVKSYYSELKNELMSYKRVQEDLGWYRETFKIGQRPIARLSIMGKDLCLFLAVDPALCAKNNYDVEDVSSLETEKDTPCLYRIFTLRGLRNAKKLIADLMAECGANKVKRVSKNYNFSYQSNEQLLKEGLIRLVEKSDGE